MAELLKVWNDWSDGMGHMVDDGQRNGYATPLVYDEPGFIGTKGSLRPSSNGLTKSGLGTSWATDSTYVLEHVFEDKDTNGQYYLYMIANAPSDSEIVKMDLANTLTERGTQTYTDRVGSPVRYKGNWYWAPLAASTRIYELTTVGAGAAADTISDDGGSNYGNCHLSLVGHQAARLMKSGGVSLLATDGSLLTGTWGSTFDVGDDDDTPLGLASAEGLTYALKGRGLYTFNDRGRAALVLEDEGLWERGSTPGNLITPWKGGVVYSHPSGLYYVRPGQDPISIGLHKIQGMNSSTETSSSWNLLDPAAGSGVTHFGFGQFYGVQAAGDYIYAIYHAWGTGYGHVLGGYARNGDIRDIVWNSVGFTGTAHYGVHITTRGARTTEFTNTFLVFQNGNGSIRLVPLGYNASYFYGQEAGVYPCDSGIWLSELLLTEEKTPRHLQVVVGGMLRGTPESEFQFWLIPDGEYTKTVACGPPIQGNGSWTIPIPQMGPVHRIQIGVEYNIITGSTAMSPFIRQIELWGDTA